MKLILTHEVTNLGAPGDIVEVKDGYGRNYLLPRQFGIIATRGAEKQVEQIRRAQKARQIRDLGHAKEVAGQLGNLAVTVKAKAASDSGRLFGSVTAAQIAEAVKKAGSPVLDRHAIEIGEQIKTVGTHAVAVRLHPEVTSEVQVAVVAS